MNVQQLQEMLRQLVQAVQNVIDSGEQLSDEFQGALAQTLQLLVNRIDQAQAQQITPQQQPELTESMPSSNIEGFAYDDKNNRLLVRFLGKYPNRNGPIYSYDNVPKVIFDMFRKGSIPARTDGQNRWGKWWKGKVPSIGASMYTLIKNAGYPYQRLS